MRDMPCEWVVAVVDLRRMGILILVVVGIEEHRYLESQAQKGCLQKLPMIVERI